jgi:hypothetical protein
LSIIVCVSVPETTRSVWIRKEDSSRVKENKNIQGRRCAV